MLKSNRNNFIVVNLVLKEKCYDSKADQGPMCPKDGYVLFQDSELLSGMLGKTLLGGGNKNGLFYRLINDNSPVKKEEKKLF
jgi:DNA-directed RNA polymerase III subunit RPC1